MEASIVLSRGASRESVAAGESELGVVAGLTATLGVRW